MLKYGGLILIIILSVVLLTGCFEKDNEIKSSESGNNAIAEQTEETIAPIYKEFDYEFDNDSAFREVEEITKLTDEDKLSNNEAEKLYDLSEFEGVTLEVRKNSDYEIAIIKLKNTDQSTQVLKKLSSRIQKLKAPEEKITIGQNNGIITVVYGTKAEKVHNLLIKQISESN